MNIFTEAAVQRQENSMRVMTGCVANSVGRWISAPISVVPGCAYELFIRLSGGALTAIVGVPGPGESLSSLVMLSVPPAQCPSERTISGLVKIPPQVKSVQIELLTGDSSRKHPICADQIVFQAYREVA